MNKAIFAAVFVSAFSSTAIAETFWPKTFSSTEGLAEVCVEHPGANGIVNILPVTIVIHDEAELTIHGESAVCYFMPSGMAKISLRFPHPYYGITKPPVWETGPVSFQIHAGKVLRLALCEVSQDHNSPNWDKIGWHNMWRLKRFAAAEVDPCGS